MHVRYSWSCPLDVTIDRYAVFVHFRGPDGRIAFQDDYVFQRAQAGLFVDAPPVMTTFERSHAVTLPADLTPGAYTIDFGLYHRVSGKKLRPRTDLPERKGAVRLPVAFEVLGR